MTEKSYWWTTNASPSGHQEVNYDQSELSTIVALLAASNGFEGVAHKYLNELEPTANGANTVAINTGGAVVDGKPYKNDASVNVNIPSTSSQLRIDRIVLRASWSAFTVTITRIAGTESASPTAPAITQTPGTTYDIMLAQVEVNSSGAVTVTDERVWALSPGQVIMRDRQGGSATDWGSPGSTDRSVDEDVMIQMGVISSSISSLGTYNEAITFPFPYATGVTPIIITTPGGYAETEFCPDAWGDMNTLDNEGFTFYLKNNHTSATKTVHGHWIAIGPRP